jgi:hypothetical protein
MRKKQSIFALNVSKLIQFAFSKGYEITLGEALRTPEQQAIYLKTGKSKTENSKHLNRLAIDLMLFKDDVFLTKTEDYTFLGDYWKELNTENVWGGDFSFGDGNHFQMTK